MPEFSTIKYVFVVLAVAIIGVSVFFTNSLVEEVAQEEQRRMSLWADATQRMSGMDDNVDLSFVLKVIEENTSIPCLLTDQDGNVVGSRNVVVDESLDEKERNEYLNKLVLQFGETNTPIEISIDETVSQFIFYDDSLLLKRLSYYPYVQWGIVVVFFLTVLFFFTLAKRSEQNKVWAGLSKETAHQLGTPISSLMALVEILKLENVSEDLLSEMEKDVNRLKTIADRFSKVGSVPELKPANINEVIDGTLDYMRRRVSNKVAITSYFYADKSIEVPLCVPLFEWVMENLCKNAVDAMEGVGKIDVEVRCLDNLLLIDVTDTGKGIAKSKFQKVFSPGFTTKKRGWGLGLSLVKRIVVDYHHGNIVVLRSELGKGTTFRITLNVK